MGKKVMAAAGLLVLGTTALSSCGSQVPPHEVRIEYLKRELYPDGSANIMASPYFNLMNMGVVDGWDLSFTYLRPRPTSLNLLAGLDRDETNDGLFDNMLVLEVTLKGRRGCELQRSDLPEHLRVKMDEQYERSTEAGYILKAFKRGVFRGVVTEEVYEELLGLCSADDEIPPYVLDMIPDDADINPDLLEILESEVPPHLERIEYLEEHLVGKTIKVDSSYFGNAIFVYDDGRGLVDDTPPETRRGTIYVMLERSNGKKPLDYYLLSVRDTDLHGNDGNVDMVVLVRYDGKKDEMWSCDFWRHEIPDEELLKKLDEHYELSTEAVYLALTEGKDSYSTIIGEGEWNKLSEFCGRSE